MTDHLSATLLNGLIDGELSSDQVTSVQRHLDLCPACTSEALTQTLLKNAVARSGQQYKMPPEFQERMNSIIFAKADRTLPSNAGNTSADPKRVRAIEYLGWAAAAVLLIALASSIFWQHPIGRTETILADNSDLVREVSDLHVAMLAASQPPQVLSSDRHTVKPWFAGKIPFSFNLPESLPADTRLEGANLVYLRGAPTAELIYSVGKHRASLFVREKKAGDEVSESSTEHAGFQIAEFSTTELVVIAVTDADRAHLSALVSVFEQAQAQSSTSQGSGQ